MISRTGAKKGEECLGYKDVVNTVACVVNQEVMLHTRLTWVVVDTDHGPQSGESSKPNAKGNMKLM
jgi:hypothetical protein